MSLLVFLYLCTRFLVYAYAEAERWKGGLRVIRHIEGVYKRFVRDELESGKFSITVWNIATVDVLRVCLYAYLI